MADATQWEQMDDTTGTAGGWRICRVRVDHRWQYELWGANGTRHGMEPSLAAAIVLFDRVKAG